jgi:hypothetical protein
MFKCGITGKMSYPGEKQNKIVIRTRKKTYYSNFYDEMSKTWEKAVSGHGYEIAEEISATQEGVNIFLRDYKDHAIMAYNNGLAHAEPKKMEYDSDEPEPRSFPALRVGFRHQL